MSSRLHPYRTHILAVIALLVAVVAVLGVRRLGIKDTHGEVVQAVAELSSAEARLDSDVLKVVSLRLPHYDSIVGTVLEIQARRRHLSALLDTPSYRATPELPQLVAHYDEQIAEKIDILEQVKGNAAFLRNEVTYIPFAVSQAAAHGTPAAALPLLDLSQTLMSLRTQPAEDVRRRIDLAIAKVSAPGVDAETAAVLPHLRSYLSQQEQLDLALGRYLAIDSPAVLAAMRGRILDQQGRDERSITLITRALGAFSALLIAGLGLGATLLIRTRAEAAVEHRYVERLEAERDQRRRIADALAEKVEQLEQTQDELVHSEKMASLGRMVAGFAHEVNTPVGVAVGAASYIGEVVGTIRGLLTCDEVSEEKLEAELHTIDEAAGLTLANLRRAAQLVESFKRTSIDQSSDACRDYLLAETVGDVLQGVRPVFKRTRIAIDVDCPPDWKVHGPAGALAQVLTNLLMNSYLHAYDEGKRDGTIRITFARDTKRGVRLDFADDGNGMPPEVVQRIFEPFFTTRRQGGGSGLGLFIVYNLVTTSLGGTIACRSQPGQGTTFTIHFPVSVEYRPSPHLALRKESVST